MPIPVKTRPRFKCQFCLSYRATLKAVEKHEGICYQNPQRFCKTCKNTGKYKTVHAGTGIVTEPCLYCSKEDKELTQSLSKK